MTSIVSLLRKTVDQRHTEYQIVKSALRREKEELRTTEAALEDLRKALIITQRVAQQVQEEAHHKIADVVSQSLSSVFEEPYAFKIKFEQKRGRTEASLVFERDGMEVAPMEAAGGGVVDVAAFALRLSCLLLSRPPLQRVLILDEPFRFVSYEYRNRVRLLLETLAKELACQFFIVTHQKEMETGTVIQL